MFESTDFVQLRLQAHQSVDVESALLLELLRSSYGPELTPNAFDRCVDDAFERYVNVHSLRTHKLLSAAYAMGSSVAMREVGPLYVANEDKGTQTVDEVSIENGIRDLWKRVADRTRDATKSVVKKVKTGVQKLFPSSRRDDKLSKKALKSIDEIASDAIEKMKRHEKLRLQDGLTAAAAEAKLDAYGKAGISEVMVRIDTVHDSRRCKKCADLDGKMFPLEQARGLLGRHPNCRCMWKLPPNAKGVKREVRLEQARQERKVMKLRERLDRRFRQKQMMTKSRAIHNESCCDELSMTPIFNQIYSDFVDRPEDCFGYIDLDLDSVAVGSYHILLSPVMFSRNAQKNARFRLFAGNGFDFGATGYSRPVLPPGTILKVLYADHNSDEFWLTIVADTVGNALPDKTSDVGRRNAYRNWAKKAKCGEDKVVALVPDAMDCYPYRLATNDAGSMVAVMLNPFRGYLETNGLKTDAVELGKLIDAVLKNKMSII